MSFLPSKELSGATSASKDVPQRTPEVAIFDNDLVTTIPDAVAFTYVVGYDHTKRPI
jgi:hypothetical protein